MTTLTLFELNSLIREVIETEMNREYWVEAELSEVRESRGHCYMELVQKEEQTNTPIARASAKCWRSTWAMVEPYFVRTTGQQLRAGMKVRMKVYAQFHEAYGFSWIITDIDPTYTLGDLARRRQEIIRQLKEEGVFDLQKSLRLPLFCQKIAVISSATAAGYGDFCRQLEDNEYGFRFDVQLFPAIMQGEQVEESIIHALDSIWRTLETPHPSSIHHSPATSHHSPSFDVVVIIRGGGATADMSGFDTLALAENVAQFPLPIVTGIGHDRDECVLDMVSHLRVKTPTAAAALLISNLKVVLDQIDNAQQRIARMAQQKLLTYHSSLKALEETLPRIFTAVKARQESRLDSLYSRLASLAQQRLLNLNAQLSTLNTQLSTTIDRRLLNERHRLQLIEEKAKSLDPALLLRRGYSITLKDGHALRDATTLHPGDEIETRLANGTIRSTVNKKSP